MKNITVCNELSWLKELYDSEYQFIFMPKRNKAEFYATKANQKKDGSFRDAAKFDVFRLLKNESWIPGDDSKGVLIHLDRPIKVK